MFRKRKLSILAVCIALLPVVLRAAPTVLRATPTVLPPETTTIKLPHQVELRLQSGAEAAAGAVSQLPIGAAGARVATQTIHVKSGRVDVLLPGRSKERGVMLLAPEGVSALSTSGHLTLIVEPEVILVAALSSDGLVGIKSRFRPLAPGVVRRIQRATSQFEDHALLGAPRLGAPGQLHLALSGTTSIPLHLTPVAGARSYRVLVSRAASGPALSERFFADPAAAVAEVPEAGNYVAVVHAIDVFGFEGAPSAPLTLHILGLEPGQDLLSHGSTIHLEPGQRARLRGAEGLLMRLGNAVDFVPAVASVGLSGQRSTTLEFKDPTDPNSVASVTLVPRLLRSQIDIGPHNVAWPDEPVQISVKLWDGQGAPLESMTDYQATVTVNGQPVTVNWTTEAGTLESTLSPQPGLGPWIVRVSLKNARGLEVIRNSLEVVQQHQRMARLP